MKKLLLLSAILLGAVSASQAGGVHFSVGFPLPLPPLPGISIGVPAPVYAAPPVYSYGGPVYGPSVAVAPPPVYYGYPGYYRPYYGYRGYAYGHGGGYYHGGHGYYGGGGYHGGHGGHW
jgi:hypothetical protein